MAENQIAELSETQYPEIFPIEVIRPLSDITVDENSTAVFACTLNSRKVLTGTWYKDGVRLETPPRENATSGRQTFMFVVTPVTMNDYGLYIMFCSDGINDVYLKGGLYVRPMEGLHNNNGYIYSDLRLNVRGAIRQNLMNVRVNVGERMNFQFSLQNSSMHNFTFTWYKSNREIEQDNRRIIFYFKKNSRLMVVRAEASDSGLYHVVARANEGVVTSFAKGVVINSNYNEPIPTDEVFEERTEVYVNAEVRLRCRLKIEKNTKIQCMKNNISIQENPSLANYIGWENYGNGHFALKIMNQSRPETAEYALSSVHPEGNSNQTWGIVSFLPIPKYMRDVRLLQPLQSVVAYLGARVLLKCSFDLNAFDFLHVVWYVGTIEVKLNDYRFEEICNNGEFYLVIRRLDTDMVGTAVCELRRTGIGNRSILFKSSSAAIEVVPPNFFAKELNLQAIFHRNVYYVTRMDDLEFSLMLTRYSMYEGHNEPHTSSQIARIGESSRKYKLKVNKTVMCIDCCRLKDDIFCYLNTSKEHDKLCRRTLEVLARKPITAAARQTSISPSNAVLKWYAPSSNVSYSIQTLKRNGTYTEEGRSNIPLFEFTDFPMKEVVKFRIKTLPPEPRPNTSTPTYKPPQTKPKVKKTSKISRGTECSCCGGSSKDTVDRGLDEFTSEPDNTQVHNKKNTATKKNKTLKRLNHPNLMQMYDDIIKMEKIVFKINFSWDEESVDKFTEKKYVNEADVILYVRQICKALEYLHSKKIVHQDVSPDNVVCLDRTCQQFRFVDFSHSRITEIKDATNRTYGIDDYEAPEVIKNKQITFASDMWSVGAMTYSLLSGVTPFFGETWPERSKNIVRGVYNYNMPAFENISQSAKDFINRLLVLNQRKRMTAKKALNHPWLKDEPSVSSTNTRVEQAPENTETQSDTNQTQQETAGMMTRSRWRKQTPVNKRRAE